MVDGLVPGRLRSRPFQFQNGIPFLSFSPRPGSFSLGLSAVSEARFRAILPFLHIRSRPWRTGTNGYRPTGYSTAVLCCVQVSTNNVNLSTFYIVTCDFTRIFSCTCAVVNFRLMSNTFKASIYNG